MLAKGSQAMLNLMPCQSDHIWNACAMANYSEMLSFPLLVPSLQQPVLSSREKLFYGKQYQDEHNHYYLTKLRLIGTLIQV